jgi:hypothetical protein
VSLIIVLLEIISCSHQVYKCELTKKNLAQQMQYGEKQMNFCFATFIVVIVVEYFLTVKLPSWVKLQRMLFTT